jgi:transcriptional regulatory protein RtcR
MHPKRSKSNVVISLLGIERDARDREYRPSILLCSQPDQLFVHRFELLFQPQHKDMAMELQTDIHAVSPMTTVELHQWDPPNPWSFEDVYPRLHTFAKSYTFQLDKEDYFVHTALGTSVMKTCFFLLVARRYIPAKLVVSPILKPGNDAEGKAAQRQFEIVDLEAENYESLVEGLRRERREQRAELSGSVKWGPTFRRLLDEIVDITLKSRSPLLLTGPTGSGKSFLAEHIHRIKKARHRVTGEFVSVNCATLKGQLVQDDLFGHIPGAWSGASKKRGGLILKADRGILFLDEIGELDREAQGKLLTCLDSHKFKAGGSDDDQPVDFELIAATNANLQRQVITGEFREDLYHRISVHEFEVPGLEHRRDDIEPFLDYVLEMHTGELYDRPCIRMDPGAREAFLNYAREAPWPGNLRQLHTAVIRMAARAKDSRITFKEVNEIIANLSRVVETSGENVGEKLLELVPKEILESLDMFDRHQLVHVLGVCRNSPSIAAASRKLFDKSLSSNDGKNHTQRLSRYLDRYGVEFDNIRNLDLPQ